MLKYYRKGADEKEFKEISYEKALDIMLGSWKDSDMTRDMLSIPNWIRCRFSEIQVKEVDENGRAKCLMPGYWNMIPDDIVYDVNCNRIKEEE